MSSSHEPYGDIPVPHCPYCDFHATYPVERIAGDTAWAWLCVSCRRSFVLVTATEPAVIITYPAGTTHDPAAS